jgi:hypothetical protein
LLDDGNPLIYKVVFSCDILEGQVLPQQVWNRFTVDSFQEFLHYPQTLFIYNSHKLISFLLVKLSRNTAEIVRLCVIEIFIILIQITEKIMDQRNSIIKKFIFLFIYILQLIFLYLYFNLQIYYYFIIHFYLFFLYKIRV